MTPIKDDFEKVLNTFKRRLTKDEVDDFKFTSLSELLSAVESIQREQGRRKDMMNLTRIQGFIEAMGQYGNVIEVFLNTSSILCFIWGPMKFCLQVASTWADSFDILLDAYEQLAESIPLFAQYQHLFSTDSRMTGILVDIYEDVLEFHQVALRVFKRSTWRQLFRAAWKDFKTRFQHLLDDLKRHKALIRNQASLIQIEESRAERAHTRLQFSMIEKTHLQQRYLEVMTWLSGVDPILDHEAAVKAREDYPSTGKWLLQERQVLAWMDSSSSLVSILWMNGIPGAGKTILASVVIETCLKSATSRTLFFYCNYQDDQRKTFPAVAKALLAQLLRYNSDLLPYLHEALLGSGQVALVSTELCRELLETSLKSMSGVHIIIDGLDECDPTERANIISFLTSRIEKDTIPGRLRAFFVSQDEHDIRKLLRGASVLRLTDVHNRNDIESYTADWCIQIQKAFNLPDNVAGYIKTTVCDRSEGMFLFAKLVLTNLHAQVSTADLEEELKEGTFPRGFEQAWESTISLRGNSLRLTHYFKARKLLGWIACSKRPLSWHEIQGALSVSTSDQTVAANQRLSTDIKVICGSLVDVLPGDRVQLVHGTARIYLVHNDYVKVHNEERKLAVLCLQYLLFDCFADSNLTKEAMKQFILQGYFVFQEYAIIHWVDHLEASIPHLLTSDSADMKAIYGSITDFCAAYGVSDMAASDISYDLKQSCAHLQASDFYDDLLVLLASTRKLRADKETTTGLGDLGKAVSDNREVMESMKSAASLSPSDKTLLELYYGKHWYKCPRHACPYFYKGFLDASARDNHVARHEKPFLCTESSCPRIYAGFSTEKDLKKHMSITHPDPANLFPKVKKLPTEHKCDLCENTYTRAHNLKAHKRTHENDRPWACNFCSKAFVRKQDKERHVNKLHPEARDRPGQSSQTEIEETSGVVPDI